MCQRKDLSVRKINRYISIILHVSHHIVFLFQECSFFFNQFLTFWSTSLCIRLKDYLFLYACQLIFCNLYLYDSEKRQLFVKQLTLLAPSFFRIRIKFACPHVSNMYLDSL